MGNTIIYTKINTPSPEGLRNISMFIIQELLINYEFNRNSIDRKSKF